MWTNLSRTFYLSPSRIRRNVIQRRRIHGFRVQRSFIVGTHLTRLRRDAFYFRNTLYMYIIEYVSQLSTYKWRSITLSIFHVRTLVAALCSKMFQFNN